mmetsp:Transcript_20689/g.38544  ORF Transcript_20689/g.38544 Transcript_20689/m.38544 type:complete len:90 (+) Transcript_20689:20-289(+)
MGAYLVASADVGDTLFLIASSGEISTVRADVADTVDTLRKKVANLSGNKYTQLQLYLNGQQLAGDHTLGSYGFVLGSTNQLVVRYFVVC